MSQSINPIIVLDALQAGHRSLADIKKYGIEDYGIKLSERTVRRHIKLIADLSFRRIEEPPYLIWPTIDRPLVSDSEAASAFGHAAYPLMLLIVLQVKCRTYSEIAARIEFIFKTKIDRKTIARNIKALESYGHRLKDRVYLNYHLHKES